MARRLAAVLGRARRSAFVRRSIAATAVVAVLVAGYGGYVVGQSHRTFTLPRPSGSLPVGRTTVEWTDTTRVDRWSDSGGPRRLSAWIWYPAAPGGQPARYAPGKWSQLHLGGPVGLAETDFNDIRPRARQDPPVAAGTFPMVILEPGLGLAAPQYQALAEEIASNGYVVTMVTPTYSANTTVLDRRVVAANPLGNPPGFSGERTPAGDATAARLLAVWVADARATAAEVRELNVAGRLARHVETTTVTYGGHSFGGAAALEACRQDPACTGAFDLDGGQYGTVAHAGLAVPVLLVGHDGSCTTSICRPSNSADRQDAQVAAGLVGRSRGGVRMVTIDATQHFNFTDYAVYYLAAPLHHLVALGSVKGARGIRLTALTLVDFLRSSGSGVLDSGGPAVTGLTVNFRRPAPARSP